MVYDAEGRLLSGGGATYTYDGEGRRIKRVAAGSTYWYWYGADGGLIGEDTPELIETGVQYLSTDALGSTRLVTKASQEVAARIDYWPFGEEIVASSSAGNRDLVSGYGGAAALKQRFTGKERDPEMGFDYFGARYLANAQGRWTSPDPKLMPDAFDDPQSWNKYGYVRNNPLRLIDPDGQDWKDAVSGWMNAISSNFVGGTGRSTGNSDFRFGQKVGDAVSMVIGAAEMAVGGGGAGGGIAACGSGVGCLAGAPAIVAGGAVANHGAMMSGAALANFVNASDDSPSSSGSDVPYESNQQNVDRMKQGKAPVDKDGKPVELHHQNQNPKGPIQEMTQQQHRGPGNYKQNHPQGNRQPSRIDRNQAARERREHWKRRAEEIERGKNQ